MIICFKVACLKTKKQKQIQKTQKKKRFQQLSNKNIRNSH